ncbi:unnamed protein product [Ceutorhynchus assimilis]|uniref:RING-type E3 ubiquitin transferase n=1 Tax=Ceutorhynchus assimilis TaxID=467358 RepID=A0A9N9MRZ1_9CUCU|nr:unnamed protein product [Ceutorhynchus assimilis]
MSSNPEPRYFLRSKCLCSLSPSAQKEKVLMQNSASKECGICGEIIMKKPDTKDRKFGLLPNCQHCFCFPCIRRWRQTPGFGLHVIHGCPLCRTVSQFAYSSQFWYDNKEEKDAYITAKKLELEKIPCKYFRNGKGLCFLDQDCPFLHAPSTEDLNVDSVRSEGGSTSTMRTDIDIIDIPILTLIHLNFQF